MKFIFTLKPLRFIDENALNELRILIDLDLSFNDISKLKLKTFEGNPNLQVKIAL